MSLSKQITERLQLLAAQGPEAAGAAAAPHNTILTLTSEAGTVQLELFDYDRYSVALHTLELRSGAPAIDDAQEYLSAAAATIARNLSYLEEPLALCELDGGAGVAQLRSSPPQHEGGEISYWEALLHAGAEPSVRLMRYRWAPGMIEREVIAYPATFALLARITDTLAEALLLARE